MDNITSAIKGLIGDDCLSELNVILPGNVKATNVYAYMGKVFVDSAGGTMKDVETLSGESKVVLLEAVNGANKRRMGDVDKIHVLRESCTVNIC